LQVVERIGQEVNFNRKAREAASALNYVSVELQVFREMEKLIKANNRDTRTG
jgi:hypothetical protein